MSGSDRGKGTPPLEWALPFIGIIVALILASGLGWLDGREAERRYQTPHRHAESAKASAERACAGLEPGAAFECVYEKVEASENTAQTEQDLSAQQRAASSALASAIVALFGLIATIVGVWFVKRTLDATLEAVQDTSEATVAMREANTIAKGNLALAERGATLDQRPWLSVAISISNMHMQRSPGTEGREVDGHIIFNGSFKVVNHGRNVATRVKVLHYHGLVRATERGDNSNSKLVKRDIENGEYATGDRVVFPAQPLELTFQIRFKEQDWQEHTKDFEHGFYIAGSAVVHYFDGDAMRFTENRFFVFAKDLRGHTTPIRRGEVHIPEGSVVVYDNYAGHAT